MTQSGTRKPRALSIATAIAVVCVAATAFAFFDTPEESQLTGLNGWTTDPVVTVGETVFGYTPTGIFDGIGALKIDRRTVRVFVNSELGSGVGYPYSLLNGTQLTGARVHYFDIDRRDRCVRAAGLAYHTVYDRCGEVVSDPSQINEGAGESAGFSRFCSAQFIRRRTFGFEDHVHLIPEETSSRFGHPHGGSMWALDPIRGEIWGLPNLGRGTWEGATPVRTGSRDTVALLLGDDFESAPLYLWVGTKVRGGNFIERNGLSRGQLYVWAADNGDLSPEDFNGKCNFRAGRFLPIDARDVEFDVGKGNEPVEGYDALGYKDDVTMRAEADSMGAFSFSRPEDLHTSPYNGKVAVMASTGRGGLFPSDNWGTIYEITVNMREADDRGIPALLSILYDGDEAGEQDFGIRSPDNLTWARNGKIYINEDRSTSPSSLFGGASGEEASIWQLNPFTCRKKRIAQINRAAALPGGQTDGDPTDIGDWESSGVLDVTHLFKKRRHERRILITDVQAHSVRDGSVGGSDHLVQGGQLLFLSQWKRGKGPRR